MRFSPSLNTVLAGMGLAVLSAASAQAQGLNGQPVNVSVRFGATGPTSSLLVDGGTKTVTPTGASFTFFGVNTVVTPTQIRLTEIPGNRSIFDSAGFNGFRVAETGGSPAPIIGFLVDPATNLPGFDLSRVSSDPTDIYINFQGLTLDAGQSVTLNIVTGPPAVPEASTTASLGLLLALGLGGLVIAAKRKKAGASL